MGIIGVVAALTIPNLNQSTGDREKVAKVKKIYSNLEDALGRATAVYGPVDEWDNGIDVDDYKAQAKRIAERMTEFMKLSKNCEFGDGCINKIYGEEELEDDFYSFILADGTAMTLDSTFTLIFDIDGLKGSNTLGKDVFIFSITSIQGEEVKLYPTWYATPEYCENTVLKDMVINDFGMICGAYWIIKNGNMDYLKCKDELDWETKTSCK